jgi:hypothetical protein
MGHPRYGDCSVIGRVISGEEVDKEVACGVELEQV